MGLLLQRDEPVIVTTGSVAADRHNVWSSKLGAHILNYKKETIEETGDEIPKPTLPVTHFL